MWLTRKLAALAHNANDHSKATSTTAAISAHAVNDDLYEQPSIPGVIDPTTKPLPAKPSCQQRRQDALTILVSGAKGIGKSTLIRLLGWKNVTTIGTGYDNACQRHRAEIQLEDGTFFPVHVVEIDDSMMDTTHDPPKFPKELAVSMIHCGLICYDSSRRDSTDCLPDLLNAHVARNIPSFLIGLKADLNSNSLRQVDTALGEELGHLFDLQLFQVDAFSGNAPSRIKDIYNALFQRLLLHTPSSFSSITAGDPTTTDSTASKLNTITTRRSSCTPSSSFHMPLSFNSTQAMMRKTTQPPPPSPPHKDNRASFYSTASSSSGYCSSDPYEKALPIKPPTAGFIYAPTATTTTTTSTTLSQTPPTASSLSTTCDGIPPPAPDDMFELYMRSRCARRRGSKDSCESGSGGLTVNDIIDRLLEASDDHIVTIFITFFRKFMKPSELVKALIDRFENDSSSGPPPTRVQERIQSIMAEWMDVYWNDFHSATARGAVVQFLDRISKEESFRPICDKLAPLAVREPPLDDPDADWGLSDDKEPLSITDDHNDTTSSSTDENGAVSPSPPAKNKKDSGYVSGSFTVADLLHNNPEQVIQAPLPPQPSFSSATPHQQNQRRNNTPTENERRGSDESTSSASKRNSAPAAPFIPPSSDNGKRQKQTTIDLKRATSFHLFHRRSRKSSMSSINMLFSSLSRPSSSASSTVARNDSTATVSATPSDQQQQQKNARTVDHAPSHQYRAEFTGGLNVHLFDLPASPTIANDASTSMSTSPSYASSLTTASHSSLFNLASFYQLPSTREPYTQYGKTVVEAPALSVAEQLTWVEAELFRKIKPRDFVRNIHPHAASAAVAASIAHFNFISAWVATLIVTQGKLTKRAALLEKFMSIAVELRNHNNYNSLMAVLAGLNSASVLRLKQTREAISDKKIFKQFQSLERLMSSDRSFSSYRLALKASEAPGIPYLGIHNQDLLSLAEANRDFRTDGTIHWEKFRLMGESIMAVMKFKMPTYTIQPNSALLQFIAECEILSEDEQYRRSNLVEPRLKSSSSTNKLRDLWMRA